MQTLKITCDVCRDKIDGHYIDGRLFIFGERTRWGYACIPCWNIHGTGKFGVGHARLYTATHEPVPYETANDPNFQKALGLL